MFKRVIYLVLFIPLLLGCQQSSLQSNPITKENLTQITTILKEAHLSNINTFEQWVTNYNIENPNATDPSDADCRMTVMLLAGDSIEYTRLNKKYTGDYLMFDLDLIDNHKDFEILKEKKDLFTTLFGEMPIPDSGIEQALPSHWKKHNIHITNKDVSIISIVFKTMDKEEVFVGHTGLWIPVDNGYAFIEKIAFYEPFMITYVKDENQLMEFLSKRKDYTTEKEEPCALVYKNDTLIGTLTTT